MPTLRMSWKDAPMINTNKVVSYNPANMVYHQKITKKSLSNNIVHMPKTKKSGTMKIHYLQNPTLIIHPMTQSVLLINAAYDKEDYF